jgi:hypothetical protein
MVGHTQIIDPSRKQPDLGNRQTDSEFASNQPGHSHDNQYGWGSIACSTMSYSKPLEATGRVPSGNQWRNFRGSTQACGVIERVEFLEVLDILAIHQD